MDWGGIIITVIALAFFIIAFIVADVMVMMTKNKDGKSKSTSSNNTETKKTEKKTTESKSNDSKNTESKYEDNRSEKKYEENNYDNRSENNYVTNKYDNRNYEDNRSEKNTYNDYSTERTKELNRNNLADDMEKLIKTDKKNDSERNDRMIGNDPRYSNKHEPASRRSHLVHRGRMRDYYQGRHENRESRFKDYEIDSSRRESDLYNYDSQDVYRNNNGNINETQNFREIQVGDLTLNDQEIKKLIALQEVLKRKDS